VKTASWGIRRQP